MPFPAPVTQRRAAHGVERIAQQAHFSPVRYGKMGSFCQLTTTDSIATNCDRSVSRKRAKIREYIQVTMKTT
jgi:hypothetical protein